MTIPFDRMLVTGADGFVGRYVVPMLASRLSGGARIVLASRTPRDGERDEIALDLALPDSVAVAVEAVQPDLVVHLAAQASVDQSRDKAADTWAVNVDGSLALARAIAATSPNCTVLQISSAEVYGRTFNEGAASETSALRPESVYARSKAAAEAAFAETLPDSSRLIVVRPANHSGPGQDERFVIPAFAGQIARIERGMADAIQVGNLSAQRDFLDVRDVVSAYAGLLAASRALPYRSVFNIASEHTVRIGEILERLQAMSNDVTTVVEDPARMRPSDVPRAALDAGAVRAAIGWSPAYGLDTMLADVLTYQRAALNNS